VALGSWRRLPLRLGRRRLAGVVAQRRHPGVAAADVLPVLEHVEVGQRREALRRGMWARVTIDRFRP
jgi:hypothetical protein